MRGWATVMDYARQHMRKDGDSDAQVQRKAVWVVFMWVVFLLGLIPVSTRPSTGVLSVMHFGLALWAWVRCEVSEAYLRVATAVISATGIYFDILGAGVSMRMWPLFVILVDVLLVIDAPRYLTKWVVGIVVVWLLILQIEFSTRKLGILDTYDSAEYDDRRKLCDCEKPPCARNLSVAMWVISLAPMYTVFLLDFFLTRGFADKVLAEKSKMAAAVQAAEDIARSLAGFDLGAAAAFLEARPELPDELQQSLAALLSNLDSYRPYLPDELFNAGRSAGEGAEFSPRAVAASVPGSFGEAIALVFTDIRSSTSLWEYSNGAAMETALTLHNDAVRAALTAKEGYEVKTVGDSFMVAFSDTSMAMRFGHAVQVALTDMAWPAGLTRAGADDGLPLLSVRMGVHCGEAVMQQNTLTGRYDYFGPTVNRAARVEPFGAPGAVTVTEEVVADVGGAAVLADVEGFVVVPYAEKRMAKGLKAPLALTALIPREIAPDVEKYVRGLVGEAPVGEGSSATDRGSSDIITDVSTDTASATVFRTASRRVFSAKVAEGACVGVIQFASFDLNGASFVCNALGNEITYAERRLQALHTAAETTRGHVTSVVGGAAWVSWGLRLQCAQYLNESSRCMVLLQDWLEDVPGERSGCAFHAGLVTGPLATVELALSSGRRFVTLLGTCVELGGALCGEAAALGAWVLAAAVDADGGHAQLVGARRVEAWGRDKARGWDVDVYELDLAALGGLEGVWA